MLEIFGFAIVFCIAVIFTFLTIYRQTVITVVYSTLAFVFWFALAQITPWVFVETPALIPLAWLWYAVGVILEVLGIYITFELLKADRQAREMEV